EARCRNLRDIRPAYPRRNVRRPYGRVSGPPPNARTQIPFKSLVGRKRFLGSKEDGPEPMDSDTVALPQVQRAERESGARARGARDVSGETRGGPKAIAQEVLAP